EHANVTQDGQRHAVDAIIYATGFQATDFLAPMQIRGLNGLELNAAWRDGAEAYKGISVAGFPNLFMLYGPNTNLAHSSIVFMLESQVEYVMQCVEALRKPDVAFMDVKPERQNAYVTSLQQRLENSGWETGCTSWYKTASGRNTNNWPGFTFSYRLATRQLNPEAYEFHGWPTVSIQDEAGSHDKPEPVAAQQLRSLGLAITFIRIRKELPCPVPVSLSPVPPPVSVVPRH